MEGWRPSLKRQSQSALTFRRAVIAVLGLAGCSSEIQRLPLELVCWILQLTESSWSRDYSIDVPLTMLSVPDMDWSGCIAPGPSSSIAACIEGAVCLLNRDEPQRRTILYEGSLFAGLARHEATKSTAVAFKNGNIICVHDDGMVVRRVDSLLRGPFEQCQVTAVAFVNANTLVVSDEYNNCVFVVSTDGQQSWRRFGHFVKPTDVAVTSAEEIVVCDMVGQKVEVLSADGRLLRSLPGRVPGLHHPISVAVDRADNIAVVYHCSPGRVVVYGHDGSPVWRSCKLPFPLTGMTILSDETIAVAMDHKRLYLL